MRRNSMAARLKFARWRTKQYAGAAMLVICLAGTAHASSEILQERVGRYLDLVGAVGDYKNIEARYWNEAWNTFKKPLTSASQRLYEDETTEATIRADMINKLRKYLDGRTLLTEIDFHESDIGDTFRRLADECDCSGIFLRPDPKKLLVLMKKSLAAESITKEQYVRIGDFIFSLPHDSFYWDFRRGMQDVVTLRRNRLKRGIRKTQRQ